jgi:hypothetical protein
MTKTQRNKIRPRDMIEAEKIRERDAVRTAEHRVVRQWHAAPRELTINSPEAKTWRNAPFRQQREHPLGRAKRLARENARAEFRAQLARERAERAEQMIELPSHIARMTKEEAAKLKAACLDLALVK